MGNITAKEVEPRNLKAEIKNQHPQARRKTQKGTRIYIDSNQKIDGGYLVPQGLYSGPQDFDIITVKNLMLSRKLAPFYKGLRDYDENWNEQQLTHAIKELFILEEKDIEPGIYTNESREIQHSQQIQMKESQNINISSGLLKKSRDEFYKGLPNSSSTNSWMSENQNHYSQNKYSENLEFFVKLYTKPIECPICFLFYPPPLNLTRCCLQPICSECFVQMKRADPHPRHDVQDTLLGQLDLISEPATCPYCAMGDFGVVYWHPYNIESLENKPQSFTNSDLLISSDIHNIINKPLHMNHTRRRSSLSATNPNVVTVDRVRPDWSKALASARARAARKAATANAFHATAFIECSQSSSRNLFRARQNHEQRQAARAHELEQIMLTEAIRLTSLEIQENEAQDKIFREENEISREKDKNTK